MAVKEIRQVWLFTQISVNNATCLSELFTAEPNISPRMSIRSVCSRNIKRIYSKRRTWRTNCTIIVVCCLIIVIFRVNDLIPRVGQTVQGAYTLHKRFIDNADKDFKIEKASVIMYSTSQETRQILEQFQNKADTLSTISLKTPAMHNKQRKVKDSVLDQEFDLNAKVQDGVFGQQLELQEGVQNGIFDQKLEFKEDVQDGVFEQQLELKEYVQDSTFDQKLQSMEDVFQNITEDGNYLVYNAYIDGSRENWILAVGLSRWMIPKVQLHCLFWDTNMRAISNETKVTVNILPRHVKERYSSSESGKGNIDLDKPYILMKI